MGCFCVFFFFLHKLVMWYICVWGSALVVTFFLTVLLRPCVTCCECKVQNLFMNELLLVHCMLEETPCVFHSDARSFVPWHFCCQGALTHERSSSFFFFLNRVKSPVSELYPAYTASYDPSHASQLVHELIGGDDVDLKNWILAALWNMMTGNMWKEACHSYGA